MTTSTIDSLVSDPRLQPAARAVLLLRVCVIAQALRPDLLERYWGELKALSDQLPASSRESFEGLRDTLEPPAPASLGGLARRIADALASAEREGDDDAMLAALHDGERRIKRHWWPSGKGSAWDTLVRAWIDVDRQAGLLHIDRLPRALRRNLLIRENDRAPLSSEEWETAHQLVPGAARAAIEELLDRDDPRLELTSSVAEEVGRDLLKAMFKGGGEDRAAEQKRDAARDRYVKLVKTAAEPSPETAERLLEQWFQETAETRFFSERWLARFWDLFRVVALWASFPKLEPRLADYVRANAPEHVREAALAHAAGLKAETAAEADDAWAALEPQLSEKGPAEHWFLLTVLRGGLPEHALEMAGRSPRAAEIVPCLRRAWLYEYPDSARTTIGPKDVAGDEIAEFLLRDQKGRVKLLRDRTQKGQAPLPTAMWKPPSVLDVVAGIGEGAAAEGAAVGSWYTKTEAKENQFQVFVRINGYGQHLYERLDPILLQTLVAWDDAHPDEVDRVTERMWETMRREIKPNIRFDLLRNDLLDRCQNALGAHPEAVGRFVQWIRRELVQQAVRQQEGDTIYTFQLNEKAPFLYAMLAAQRVAPFSARRCDEIIEQALDHPADDDLLSAAGQLYAADKGLAGLDPPGGRTLGTQLSAWQLGVVETAFRDLLAALAEPGPTET